MDYLSKNALIFLAEQENILWERFKKYLTDNQEFFAMMAIAISGSYNANCKILGR